MVVADPHQIEQVFLNIINNAVDAILETGRSGKLKIRISNRVDTSALSSPTTAPGSKIPSEFSIRSIPPRAWAKAQAWA